MGYGAFPLSIIEYLWRAKQPYNVSVAAEVSACAALQNPTYLEVLLLQVTAIFFSPQFNFVSLSVLPVERCTMEECEKFTATREGEAL